MIIFGIKLCACAFDDVFKDKFLKYFNFFLKEKKRKKTNKKKIKNVDKINSHSFKCLEKKN